MSSVVECCHTDTVDIWLHSQPVPNADGEYNCLHYTNFLQNSCDHAHIKLMRDRDLVQLVTDPAAAIRRGEIEPARPRSSG